jgi:hypothetical protein
LASGCMCSLYLKYIKNKFDNIKNQTKILCVHLHVLRVYEMVYKKNTFYMTYLNMTKFNTKISFFMTYYLSFFAQIKNVCFSQNYA